ncbi:bifunctional DNA-formamidopyrimidine glycosylase/DNA-(apurinic or apyrimidinic site) lyase [Candidatus Parcubacteria bacterium]|nr:MAG: bifunctional DNA-formamidopyrimidine glycosylase/DNA-(apurinic or apyrimidinic site) lyase [Candidatus Parcubacteria bacterium]
MPELPEVETVVRGLNRKVRGLKIKDVWSDWPKYFKPHLSLFKFKKHVVGKKINIVHRRGKNILFNLSDGHVLLIHQKMTGHLLIGNWIYNPKGDGRTRTSGFWRPVSHGPLQDPRNDFIHLMFFLNNGRQLALSDARKFAKVLCGPREEIFGKKDISSLGPEPLDAGFAFEKFKDLFKNKKGRIKQVIMDQNFIVGIGNIYSDDILYSAKVHPLSRVENLPDSILKKIYKATRTILQKAIRLGGTSIDDFRNIDGKKGYYDKARLVYQKEKCPKGHFIKRIRVGGRTASFCSKEQRIYKGLTKSKN